MNRNRGRKIVEGIRTGLSDVETGPDELIKLTNAEVYNA